LFLQNLLSYPSLQAGLVMSPRGFGAILGSIISGRILASSKIDGRTWIAGGFAVLALSMYMFGNFTIDIAPSNVVWPIVISGFAITCIFVPMTTFSMATVSRESMGEATGLTSLLRNLGGSVGIASITTLVSRGAQTHQALMVDRMSSLHAAFNEQVAKIQGLLTPHAGLAAAQKQTYGILYQTLQQQASLLSYVDQFRTLVVVCLLCAPLVLLFKRPGQGGKWHGTEAIPP
jgi:DHA2 family multidrug resistance protein